MTLAEYRQKRGLTQSEVALALGLTSKAYISQLETRSVDWPIELALEVEFWSQGEVLALDILSPAKAALLRRAIQRHAAEVPA